ncbi:MAG: hypothetical protein HUU55_17470 [Myxococcales bacterium]|nr:hypothetical protein [Myxococcales bacterium]
MRLRFGLVPVLLLSAACVSGPGESRYIEAAADYELFVEHVLPVLADRCANPSCHGNVDRPLQLFAVHQHRVDPSMVFSDLPLTEEEIRLNYQRSLVFVSYQTSIEQCPLISKPLAVSAGGVWHGGGAQFYEADDPQCDVIRTWLENTTSHQGHIQP